MTDDGFPPGLQGAELDAALAIVPFHKWLGLRVVSVDLGPTVRLRQQNTTYGRDEDWRRGRFGSPVV